MFNFVKIYLDILFINYIYKINKYYILVYIFNYIITSNLFFYISFIFSDYKKKCLLLDIM